METKICKKCGRELPLSEFYKNKNCKDGYLNVCKECFIRQQKQYNKERKEEILEYAKQYYQGNKEKKSEYNKQYRQEHKEEIAEHNKQYYKDNKEAILEQHKQYQQEHKEEINEYFKQYYQDNKENYKQYYQTPMGRASTLVSAYRQEDKKYNRGECTLTPEWIIDNIFTQPCHWCKKTDWHKIGCDRIDNSLPHTPDNVNPCCEECNKKRGRRTYEEFLLMI